MEMEVSEAGSWIPFGFLDTLETRLYYAFEIFFSKVALVWNPIYTELQRNWSTQ